jgi:uncharacterized protein (TIGR03435 family)
MTVLRYDRPRCYGLRRPRLQRSQLIAWLAALAFKALVTPIILGQVHGQPSQEPHKLAFDAASIHEWDPDQGPPGQVSAGLQFSAGRARAQCVNLQGLVYSAYQLSGSELVEGMPRWGGASCGSDSRDTFAIEATMPAGTTPAQSREMLQTLLAERFKLAVHWETRQLPVYALRIALGKSKLEPSDPEKDPPFRPSGARSTTHTAILAIAAALPRSPAWLACSAVRWNDLRSTEPE